MSWSKQPGQGNLSEVDKGHSLDHFHWTLHHVNRAREVPVPILPVPSLHSIPITLQVKMRPVSTTPPLPPHLNVNFTTPVTLLRLCSLNSITKVLLVPSGLILPEEENNRPDYRPCLNQPITGSFYTANITHTTLTRTTSTPVQRLTMATRRLAIFTPRPLVSIETALL